MYASAYNSWRLKIRIGNQITSCFLMCDRDFEQAYDNQWRNFEERDYW